MAEDWRKCCYLDDQPSLALLILKGILQQLISFCWFGWKTALFWAIFALDFCGAFWSTKLLCASCWDYSGQFLNFRYEFHLVLSMSFTWYWDYPKQIKKSAGHILKSQPRLIQSAIEYLGRRLLSPGSLLIHAGKPFVTRFQFIIVMQAGLMVWDTT